MLIALLYLGSVAAGWYSTAEPESEWSIKWCWYRLTQCEHAQSSQRWRRGRGRPTASFTW